MLNNSGYNFSLLETECDGNIYKKNINLFDKQLCILIYSPYFQFDIEAYRNKLNDLSINICELYITNQLNNIEFEIPIIIALYDSNEDILILIRDQLGIIPFYWTQYKNNLEYGISAKSLVKQKLCTNILNVQTIDLLLTCQYIPGSRTIWKDINRLPAGHVLIKNFKKDTLNINKYWDLNFKDENDGNYDIPSTLLSSCNYYNYTNIKCLSLLSGGIDSSINLANLAKLNREVVPLTIAFKENEFDESEVARKYSNDLGFIHKSVEFNSNDLFVLEDMLKSFEEPCGDQAAMATYIGINKVNTGEYKLLYSGEGGDEIFGSPRKFSQVENEIKKNNSDILTTYIKYLEYLNTDLRFYLYNEDIKKYIDKEHLYNMLNDLIEQSNADSLISKLSYIQYKTWLVDNVIAKDRYAAKANNMVACFPLISKNTVELLLSSTNNGAYEKLHDKNFVKSIYKTILPDYILTKPKHTFEVPMKKWFDSKELITSIFGKILNDSNLLWEIIDINKVKKLLQEHIDKKKNYSLQLWQILSLALWIKNNDINI